MVRAASKNKTKLRVACPEMYDLVERAEALAKPLAPRMDHYIQVLGETCARTPTDMLERCCAYNTCGKCQWDTFSDGWYIRDHYDNPTWHQKHNPEANDTMIMTRAEARAERGIWNRLPETTRGQQLVGKQLWVPPCRGIPWEKVRVEAFNLGKAEPYTVRVLCSTRTDDDGRPVEHDTLGAVELKGSLQPPPTPSSSAHAQPAKRQRVGNSVAMACVCVCVCALCVCACVCGLRAHARACGVRACARARVCGT
jgi:hypothetical protein